jgi:acetoacetyl-CoA reductase
VAANYVRGTQVAQSFEKQTGVRTFQWDVADGEGRRAGVARAKDELGPVDILVTNAGITLDRAFHKMSDSEWLAVACRACASCRASVLRRPPP